MDGTTTDRVFTFSFTLNRAEWQALYKAVEAADATRFTTQLYSELLNHYSLPD